MQKIRVILKRLKNLLTNTNSKKSSGTIKTQPTTSKTEVDAEFLFDVYSDEALIAAIEAGMIDQVCSAASLDFQMVKENNYGKSKAYA